MNPTTTLPILAFIALVAAAPARAQVPGILNYQGRVTVGGTNLTTNAAQFKFALVNGDGTVVYWRNDGSTAAGEPSTAVSVAVAQGLYSTLIGDTALGNMAAIPASVFTNENVNLRVWFSAGGANPFVALTPDQRLGASGYALRAATADNASITNVSGDFAIVGTLTVGKLVGGIGNTAGGLNAVVVGGSNNVASGQNGSVGGGLQNAASGVASTIGGGGLNNASDLYTTIGGGKGNKARARYATIGGGEENTAGTNHATIGGGWANTAGGIFATIGGGQFNTASGSYATIGGGRVNTNTGLDATIGGGQFNTASGWGATISGGLQNTNSGYAATIGGGLQNTSDGEYPTIGGGVQNSAGGYYSVIGGGVQNTAVDATVAGGSLNTARDGIHSAIGGGVQNTNTGSYSTIGGGRLNTVNWNNSVIAGGELNTANNGTHLVIGGGYRNTNNGAYSTIGGGSSNMVGGIYATVPGGIRGIATNRGAFVWSGVDSVDTVSTNDNSFTVRAPGGARFLSTTNTNSFVGVILTNNATSWASLSDSNSKTDFAPIRPREVLQKLAALPMSSWHYKHDLHRRYIGPMAQDFHTAFGLGDEKTISTLDSDGVMYAAIQGLVEELKERDKTIEELKAKSAEVDALKAKLEAVEQRLNSLPPAP